MSEIPINYANLDAQISKAAREGYLHRVLVGFLDVGTNVLTGGIPGETISSRVRRVTDAHRGKWSWNPGVWLARGINAGLNRIQPDHGQHAEWGDLGRAERVEHIEEQALDLKEKP